MTSDKRREALLSSLIFRGLPAERLEEIASAARIEAAPARSVIYREGDPGDSFYIVASGRIRVFTKHDKGVERDISILGAGESFGEVALMAGECRSTNVDVLEDARLLVLGKDSFQRMLQSNPEVSKLLIRKMRTWLIEDRQIIGSEAEQAYEASHFSWSGAALIALISIVLALSFNHTNPNGIPIFPAFPDISTITAVSATTTAGEWQRGEVLIVDAMPTNFYQKRHVKGALNMPLPLFDIVLLMTFTEDDRDRRIVVYGNSVSRPYDQEIASKLVLRGYTNVKLMQGGLPAWEKGGYPVEEGTPPK